MVNELDRLFQKVKFLEETIEEWKDLYELQKEITEDYKIIFFECLKYISPENHKKLQNVIGKILDEYKEI